MMKDLISYKTVNEDLSYSLKDLIRTLQDKDIFIAEKCNINYISVKYRADTNKLSL